MINQLVNNIKKLDAPIVVGLDPMLDYVPEYIKKAAFAEYGETLEGAAEAIWQYNKGIIDATYDLIPAVKPQIAMYEQFGVPGLVAFNKTCEYAKSKGLVIIGDIKRGDIGSTSKAYAIGHVGKVAVGSKTYSGFCEDFVTVNPYLGSDGIRPFMEVCKEEKKGMFILVKTSNPSSGEFQDQEIDGKPLYEMVAEKVASWGEVAHQHIGFHADAPFLVCPSESTGIEQGVVAGDDELGTVDFPSLEVSLDDGIHLLVCLSLGEGIGDGIVDMYRRQ